MIKRKTRTCIVCGRDTYLFGKGMCQSCYRAHKAKQIINEKFSNSPVKASSLKSNTKPPPATKNRLTQMKQYSDVRKKMDNQKKIFCFFCGGKMKHPEEHHHLIGRDGDLLVNEKYIVHVHAECHRAYHNDSVHSVSLFDDFLNRLSDIDEQLAYRESLKKDK